MKYDIRQLKLLSNDQIADGIFDMRLDYPEGEIPVQCGQFAHVYVPGKSLRRPISVCDARDGVLRLVYQIKGEGTKIMSQMQSCRRCSPAAWWTCSRRWATAFRYSPASATP